MSTIDFGLWYSFDITDVLVGYCDAIGMVVLKIERVHLVDVSF